MGLGIIMDVKLSECEHCWILYRYVIIYVCMCVWSITTLHSTYSTAEIEQSVFIVRYVENYQSNQLATSASEHMIMNDNNDYVDNKHNTATDDSLQSEILDQNDDIDNDDDHYDTAAAAVVTAAEQ